MKQIEFEKKKQKEKEFHLRYVGTDVSKMLGLLHWNVTFNANQSFQACCVHMLLPKAVSIATCSFFDWIMF